MKIWLVKMWVDLDGDKVPAGTAAFTSYEKAERYVKKCAKGDGVPAQKKYRAGYTSYTTPETEEMRAMEYIIQPLDVHD